MNPMPRVVLYSLILLTILVQGRSNLLADTVSWPVSVAVPTGMAGDMNSKPVSVAIPTGISGDINSKPVSVAIPTASIGGVYESRPVTVGLQPENLGDPDLVGLWYMDGDWTDSSGNGNHGTPTGALFSNNNVSGSGSGYFNGNSYVTVPASDSLQPANAITVSAWVYPYDVTTYHQIVTKRYADFDDPYNSYILSSSGEGISNKWRFCISSGSAGSQTCLSTPETINANAWSQVIGTYDGSNLSIYVNGILRASTTKSGAIGYSSQTLRIGTSVPSTGQFFNGLIDELEIYKRALTADEIAESFASGIGSTDPNTPATPVVGAVPAFVGSNSISLSGTRPAGTSIWVNSKIIAPSDSATTWQGSYSNLLPGVNLLNITALDETRLLQSQPVSKTVFYDNIQPVIENSIPVNNSNTAKLVGNVSITLYDANSGVDTTASTQGAVVRNAVGQTIAGAWSASGTRTIIFTPNVPFVADTYTVTIQATDLVGNKQPQQIVFTNHDTSAPTTKIALTGTKDSAGWYSTPVTVTFSADDTADGSGVAKVEYSLDNGTTWLTYATPFVIDQDGKMTVQYRATDKAGNVETTKSQDIKINKTGLVGWWKMDGDWKDSSLVGNDGIPYNGATFSTDAKIGNSSGQFNGSNMYVSVPDSPTIHSDRNITISGWIFVNDFNKTWQSVVWKGNTPDCTTSCENREFALWLNSSGYILLSSTPVDRIGIGESALTTPSGSIQDSRWQHFAAVVSSDQSFMKIYIDGVEKATSAYSSLGIRDTANPLMLGGNPSWDSYFNGLLDDIRVYNRALSPTEVLEQYRNFAIGVPTVYPVILPTNTPTITLSGTKPVNTSVVISSGSTGVEFAPQTDAVAWAATTWQGQYTLTSGMNNLNITAKDVDGFHSQAVTLSVALDDKAPVVSSSNPANGAIFNAPVATITFNLTDVYSPLDLAATIAGATVKSSSNIDVGGSWITSGSGVTGAATFTASMPMGEGSYTATIAPTDSFGNAASASISFTVDMTAPSVPAIDPVPSLSNTTGKTITGSKSSDSTRVVVTIPGATIGTISYPTATTWSVSVFGLKEGVNTITVYSFDSAGNQSIPVSVGFTIDLTPPAKPTIDTPVTPTNKAGITLTGSKEANSWLYVNNSKTSAPLGDTTWSSAVSISEGSNTITVFARDEAGNQSASAQVAVVRDSTPPTIASSTPTTNAISGAVGSISITLAAAAQPDLAASTVGAVVKNALGTVISGLWSVAGTAIVFTPSAALPEGVYTVTIYPVDILGNKGSASFSFTVDRTPPSVQTLTITPVSPLKAGTATFTLVFSKNMDITVQPQVTFGSSNYRIAGAWIDNSTWRGSYSLTVALGDSSYTITVKGAKDIAGNTMADQVPGNFILKTTPPAAPTVVVTTPLTKTANQLLTGTKPGDTALVINTQVRIPLSSATSWSYNYLLSEGNNTLTIAARDAAGNDSAAIAPAPVINLDTTPPAFTVDIYKNPATSAVQVISGTKEPGCVVRLNGVVLFDVNDQSSTWSSSITLVDGMTNHLVFTATDAIGNITTKILDILFDSVPPPALGSGVLTADGSGKGTEATLSWPSYPELTALAYYRVYQASADFNRISAMTPIGTVSKGTKSYKATGLIRGTTYFFAVVPVSTSGNSDPSVHTAFAIPADTLPPEDITGLSAVAGYSAADGNTATLYWSASANTNGDLADQILYVDDGKGYDAGTSLGKTVVSFTKKGLIDATLYKFKITTKDTLNHESAGTVTTAVTRLANPTGLIIAAGNAKATLTWSAVASSYVKYYNIYRVKSDTAQTDISGMTLVKSQTTTSFTDTGLTNDSIYQYAVTVLNTSGAERTSVQSVAVTPRGDTTGPVISGLNLTATQVISAQITITASAADAESTMDRIELYIDTVKVATVTGSTLSYNWNVIDTTDGNHAVKIVAYDAPGNKSETTVPVVVSLAPPPIPIITSTFNGPINQKTVAINGTTQMGSLVSLRVNGVVVATLNSQPSTFNFSSVTLAEGDNYVAVKAANRGGESPFSADTKITVITTAPSAPTGLAVKQLVAGSVQFSWLAGATGAASGYNLYEAFAPFSSTSDAGVKKTNPALIAYLLKEYIPADDTLRYYAVTSVDGAGNESPISNIVSVASDRLSPTGTVSFSTSAGNVPSDNTYGPGQLNVLLTVSEVLKEAPFLSLEPQSGSPIVVALLKTDDTHYMVTQTIDATSPHGPTVWKFSGKDMVGNRGNSQGTGPIFDVRGPQASITSPVTLLKTTGGAVPVSITLDEASTITPVMTLTASDGSSASITGMTSTDNIHWSGTVDPSALSEGVARFTMTDSRDRFGNQGTSVVTGKNITLYKTTPPAPSVPMGLTAKAFKAGEVKLAWLPVTDAQSYTLYRKRPADTAPVAVGTIPGGTTTYTEKVPVDGTWSYSISSIGLLNAESAQSASVSVVTDATPPPVPTGLVLSITGNGVKAEWQAGTGDTSPYYRLYHSASPITDITGLTPIATVNQLTATDPSPDKTMGYYCVTSMDQLGNESAPSASQEITFPVTPVRNLVLTKVDDGKPTLAWEAGENGLLGFHIYRNGSRVTTTPTLSVTFSDGYYSSGTVTYGISAVNATGTESPVREAILPELTIGLKEGTTLRRGVLENVVLTAAQPATATTSIIIDAVSVKIGNLPESTENGPFDVPSDKALEISKVAATEANAPSQVAVVATAIMTPTSGVTIKITKTGLASLTGSGTALEIFNEPLVRGTQAKIRLKINNLGTAATEILTSENNGPTAQVTVNLRDQDGNLLAQGSLDQRTGSAVVNSAGYATARLNPGENFLSDPITFTVPSNAPYKVSLETQIQNTYFHYNQPDQVTAPGLKQTVDAVIFEVPYTATAQVSQATFKQGETIAITGTATSTTDATPMPNVPVKIGVSVNGFDRYNTATTDANGVFTYTFTPGTNETGTYSVWAIHPDLTDRAVQAQFSIIGLQVSPKQITVTTTKSTPVDIPITLKNLSMAAITGLTLTADASSGITASVSNASDTLSGGETRTISLKLAPQSGAPDSGYANLNITSNEGLNDKVQATITLVSAIPVINTSPSYIDTGIVRGNQKIVNFTITNSGIETLINPRIEGPSLPWLTLTIDKNLGDIPAKQSKTVGIMVNPGETIPQGVYDDRIVIYSDNHIPYTYNIQITVTSSAVGSVQFSVLNELMKDVANASITFQHQSVLDLIQTVKTGQDGTATQFDIPEGRYSYNISSPGATPYSGSFVIEPGITTNVPVALEVNLVTVEWSVTPVVITDSYEIKVSQTFETNVPTPVLVTEPPNMTLPDLQPGQVYNGEFTVTNYGLIDVYDVHVNFPTSFEDYDVEVLLSVIPAKIGAMQKITVPYRITRRVQTAATTTTCIGDEITGYGGGGCFKTISWQIKGKCVICPNSPMQRVVDKITSFFNSLPTTCAAATTTSITPITSNVVAAGGSTQSSGGGGLSTPIGICSTPDCGCVPPKECCPIRDEGIIRTRIGEVEIEIQKYTACTNFGRDTGNNVSYGYTSCRPWGASSTYNEDLQGCLYKCAVVHEDMHKLQCQVEGWSGYNETNNICRHEVAAYNVELKCLYKLLDFCKPSH